MSKLELLIRKNKGKKEQVQYCERLNTILGTSLSQNDFIELEESDSIVNTFYASFKAKPKFFLRRYTLYEQGEIMDDLIKNLHQLGENAFLITRYTENCRLVKVPCDKAIQHYADIIDLDGDSLRLFSEDHKGGLYLDYFEEYNHGIQSNFYETAIWL